MTSANSLTRSILTDLTEGDGNLGAIMLPPSEFYVIHTTRSLMVVCARLILVLFHLMVIRQCGAK